MVLFNSCAVKLCCLGFSAAAFLVFQAAAQSPDGLSQFFEGKQITVKMDMPATQKGVDVYPDRPQPLDAKKYADRLKEFGASLRNGDTVMITKVKLKNGNVEFQLGGGGYGTAGDVTDGAVRFTPAEKSSHEKELEQQLKSETDPERRRAISRELDNLRRDRERRDRRNRSAAEADAEVRRERIDAGRRQGGSRFNIHFDKAKSGDALGPQVLMAALARYVDFPPEMFGPNGSAPGQAVTQAAPETSAAQGAGALRKGLTRAQVEALFGPPMAQHESTQGGLSVTSCTYQNAAEKVQADYVNGVMVQYTVSSR
jgi:hypothetical protein